MTKPTEIPKINEKIRRLIQKDGRKGKDLAEFLGVQENRISDWKKGVGVPTAYHAAGIAKWARIPLEWLTDDDDDEIPSPRGARSVDEQAVLVAASKLGFGAAYDLLVGHYVKLKEMKDGAKGAGDKSESNGTSAAKKQSG